MVKWFPSQWFRFEDGGEVAYASPDLYGIQTGASPVCLLVEFKLSQTPLGRDQLEFLYGPLLRAYLGLPIRACLCFRNWRGGADLRSIRSPTELFHVQSLAQFQLVL
jgi:hypothetical protein